MSENIELGQAVGKAFVTWLKTVFYFIVLPFKIWKASTLRLSAFADSAIVDDDEEFPVYTFNKINLDASIFILGILAVPTALVGVGFGIYFVMIPLLSFFKEVLTMSLVTVKRLEDIDHNTRRQHES